MRRNVLNKVVDPDNQGGLVSRNVYFSGRRSSIRLEREMWDALVDVARRENKSIHQICTEATQNNRTSSQTALVYLLKYYQALVLNFDRQ
jgi:predicted DNA-binding ribbon-helix-helix protein